METEEQAAETISALSTSVRDLDGSRRVGWAKAYEAEEARAEAERMQESMRFQRDKLRSVASFFRGYLMQMSERLGVGLTGETLNHYMRGIEYLLEDGASREGRREAMRAFEKWVGITDEQIRRERLKADQRRRRRAENTDFSEVMKAIAKQYHFPDVKELRSFLRWYRDTQS